MVQAFVNTVGIGKRADTLATPRALADWLVRRRLLAADVELDKQQWRQGLGLRASLRALILDISDPVAGEELRHLEQAARRARFELRFDDSGRPEGFVAAASGRVEDALGALIATATAARLEGTWSLLKLCAEGGCRRAFFDSSRKGKWCTPRCGYRVRTATYRRTGKHYRG